MLGQAVSSVNTLARAFCAESAASGVYPAGCPVQYSRGGGSAYSIGAST